MENKKLLLSTPQILNGIVSNESMQNRIKLMINEPKRRDSFITSLMTMVQKNPMLQDCESGSLINAVLSGEALGLPHGLSYYYVIPFNNNKKGATYGLKSGEFKEAQFQIGWKGIYQLALRTNQYKRIVVSEIKEGELQDYNPIFETFNFVPINDFGKRTKAITIGYYAMFELKSGFIQEMYWPIEKMEEHANKYSQAFKLNIYRDIKIGKIKQTDMWKYSSFWYKDFDAMAKKTVLKQLLSKFGPMNVELLKAVELDQSSVIIDEHGSRADYIDNQTVEGLLDQKVIVETQADVTKVEKKVDMFEGFENK